VLLQVEAPLVRDLALALLDLGVDELLDMAAVHAHEVVVVRAFIELEDRSPGLEVPAHEQAGLLELGEDPVDRRQADLDPFLAERAIDVLGAEVAHAGFRRLALEDFQYAQAGRRGLEAAALEFGRTFVLEHGVQRSPNRFRRRSRHLQTPGATPAVCDRRVTYHSGAPACEAHSPRFAHLPQIMRLRFFRLLAALGALAVASACTSTPTVHQLVNIVRPYRPDVQQGNVVTHDMVDQLRPGMTRDQVRFMLGTPMLRDVFHADRWDYPYILQRGTGERQMRKLVVFFADGRLSKYESDPMPAEPLADTLILGDSKPRALPPPRKEGPEGPSGR